VIKMIIRFNFGRDTETDAQLVLEAKNGENLIPKGAPQDLRCVVLELPSSLLLLLSKYTRYFLHQNSTFHDNASCQRLSPVSRAAPLTLIFRLAQTEVELLTRISSLVLLMRMESGSVSKERLKCARPPWTLTFGRVRPMSLSPTMLLHSR
jgi:hypothetical protein